MIELLKALGYIVAVSIGILAIVIIWAFIGAFINA